MCVSNKEEDDRKVKRMWKKIKENSYILPSNATTVFDKDTKVEFIGNHYCDTAG